MISLAMAAAIASQGLAGVDLPAAAHALEAGRIVQAKQMLAEAAREGRSGPEFDRLLADLAFAQSHWPEAEARYAQLLAHNPSDARSAERGGIAALQMGDVKLGKTLIRKAVSSKGASWRAWNALGVLCDFERDWDGADAAYATADEIAPDRPEILNNHGWSLILRGDWTSAVPVLERAARLDPKSGRIANNLELARTAVAADLPRRRPGESDSDFAARLNDAGIAAELRGDRARAMSAYARALTASDSWYVRAANNLSRVEQK